MSSEEAAAAAGGTASNNKDGADGSNDAKDTTTRNTRTNKSKSTNGLEGVDIAKIMSSAGPVVKCVLLKHMSKTGRDTKPQAPPKDAQDDGHPHKRPVLTELIEEISVDTTPAKNQVQNVLGGPFTFLGQYPDEGIVVMARREIPADLEDLSVHKVRALCKEFGVKTESMLEKSELVEALWDAQLPVNPHQLQPPLDGIVVRGDILLMRVADTDEVLDKDDDEDEGEGNAEAEGDEKEEAKETAGADAATKPQVTVPSNEEFFLDYSKKEWIAFASRTDVVAPEVPEGENDDEFDEDDEDEEEDEDEYDAAEGADDDDDEDDDEEERRAMLNLIMGEVLKRFRNENGRGPDTRELLELRSQVANQLGVEVATFYEGESKEEEKEGAADGDDAKRPAGESAEGEGSAKKVKFTAETKDNGDDEDDDDNDDDNDAADDNDNQKNGETEEKS